jgi:hypothetical protein
VTSFSFETLLNGLDLKLFRSGRGLRHGYILSPLLFIIVSKGLSREINDAKITRALKGIKIGGIIFLSQIFFVDDILLFNHGSRSDVMNLKEILNVYFTIAGMLVNFQESTLSLSCLDDDDDARFIAQLFSYQEFDF